MTVSRWWKQRSSPQRLDMYIRWSLYVTSASVLPIAMLGVMAIPDARPIGLTAFFVLLVAHTVASLALLRAGLSTLLGGPPPGRSLVIGTFGLTVAGVLAGWWAFPEPSADQLPMIVLIVVLLFGGTQTSALTPVLSRQALYTGIGIGTAITAGWYALAGDEDWSGPVGLGLFYAILIGLLVVVHRVQEWMLVLIWEIDASRTVQAKLAVAEERLRFARDFHDVLGRNLTLIAVTSDLAAGLARRGDPDAVDKMLQVRSLAHESAREVREVVTGYRAADLDTELAGARSVLRAAGITTRVIGDSNCVPADAQTALAWVLREATTNVIRHSNATTCTIELGIDPRTEAGAAGTAVLRIHNDGAPPLDPFHPPGHGLAGLRERVKASGGQLAAGPEPGGGFTVEARLPAVSSTTPTAALDPAP